jgi:hypothetical protein
MNFNDKAAVRAGSNGSGIGSKNADEIDLYDELLAFLKLSPAQKLRYLNRPVTGSSKDTTQNAASETVVTAFSEQANVEVGAPASVSTFTGEAPAEAGETACSSPRVAEEFSAGATLAELNPQYVFTNAPSGQACGGCGAQSEADDLFCMSCGAFLNGVGAAEPFDPSCRDCSRDIQADEIFCPWCGATLSGN